MVLRVIILIAFKWILFQMLADTETSQRNDPHVLFYCESCFLPWLNVRQLLLSISVRGLSGSSDTKMDQISLMGIKKTYCPHYPRETLHLTVE